MISPGPTEFDFTLFPVSRKKDGRDINCRGFFFFKLRRTYIDSCAEAALGSESSDSPGRADKSGGRDRNKKGENSYLEKGRSESFVSKRLLMTAFAPARLSQRVLSVRFPLRSAQSNESENETDRTNRFVWARGPSLLLVSYGDPAALSRARLNALRS